ncbi:MAG: hypothetical protein IPM11_00680 [Micropruina sp.]|jgi:hypothetical protein|nr:hypothetical protein [Micropruina sp.]
MTLNPPSRVTPDKPKDLHVTLLPTRAGITAACQQCDWSTSRHHTDEAGIKAWDKHLPICGLGKWRVR